MALGGPDRRLHDDGMASELSAAIDTTWLAADLEPDARTRLEKLAALTEVPAGSVVVQQGEHCAFLGVVLQGRIALRLRLPGGQDRTILTLDPGDVYGWSAVVRPWVATSTGVALVPTRAIVFDGDRLRSALATDHELAAAVYGRLLETVARRLVTTRVQLLDIYRAGYEAW